MADGIVMYLKSSIGQKYLMAISGLVWTLFVMTHMLANMLILFSPEAYNKYSHALISNPLIYIAEAGLVVFLGMHVWNGFSLKMRNARAKPSQYAVTPKGPKGASLSSRSMIYSGSITLVFLILHLITFKFGTHYDVTYDGVVIRDLHRLVIEVFQSPAYVAWYLFCLVLVGLHLYHGVASSFQTLGINHPRVNGLVKKFGYAYAIIVAAGFISQPLYVLFAASR